MTTTTKHVDSITWADGPYQITHHWGTGTSHIWWAWDNDHPVNASPQVHLRNWETT